MKPFTILLLLIGLGVPLWAQPDAAADDFNFAAGLHDRALFDRGIPAFEGFLAKWPKDVRCAKAHFYLGQCLAAMGRDKDALPHFEAYVKSNEKPLRARALLRSGEMEHRIGRHDAAVKRLAALMDEPLEPDVREATLYYLAEAQGARGQADLAKKAYEVLLSDHGKGAFAIHSRVALGFLNFEAGDTKNARAQFESVAKQGSDDPDLLLEALVMSGECDLAEGNHQAALSRFEKILERGADRFEPQVRLGMGRALLGLKRAEDGVKALIAVSEGFPDDPRLPRTLLRAAADLHEQARPELGLELLRRVTNATGQDAKDLAYWSGRLLEAGGKMEEAIEKLRAAADTSPRRKFSLGDALSRAGRHEEAVAVFKELRGCDDPMLRSEAAFAEAFAYNRLGQHEQAASILTGITKEKLPKDLARDAWFALGENLFSLEKYDAASPWYGKVVKAGPGPYYNEALHKAGWCCWLKKDLEGCERAFASLLETDAPPALKSEARYLIAKVFEATGKHQEARKIFADLATDPSAGDLGPKALLGQAAALRQSNQHEEAAKLYEALLSKKPTPELRGVALAGLGDAHLALGQHQQAIAAYDGIVEKLPDHPTALAARLNRGWAYRALAQPAMAVRDAQVVIDSDDATLRNEGLYLLGLAEHESGHHEAAVRALDLVLREANESPRRLEAELVMGLSLARLARHGDARAHFKKIIDAGPKTPGHDTALYELGFGLDAEKNTEGRDAAFARLLKDHPKSTFVADATFRLANSAYDAARFDEAAKRYASVAESGPESLRDKALYKLGWCEKQRKRFADSAETFARVAAMESDLAGESAYLAGEAYETSGALEEAATFFRSVREKHSKHELAPDAACREVLVLAKLKRMDEVIELAPSVLTRHEKEPRALEVGLALGNAFFARKQWGPARTAYGRVTKSSEGPMAAEAQYLLGKTHQEEGRTERALDEYLRVSILYAHKEWVAKATWEAALLLEQRGDKNKAERLLRDLAKNYSDTEEGRRAARKLGN